MDVVSALTELGGISSYRALLTSVSRKQLRVALDKGLVVRVCRGRYALPGGDLGLTAARELGGHLSHLSAATHHGWEVALPTQWPQLIVPPGTRPPLSLARPETWELVPRPGEVDGLATSPVLTVLLCARDLPFAEALAVADSALRHGAVTWRQLDEAAAHWCRGNEAEVRRVVALADARAANPFESMLRGLAIEAGLDVVPQWEIGPFHVDVADPLRGIALEADSWEFHGDRVAFERDCRRYNQLVLADWIVLRYTWRQVVLAPRSVVEELRRLACRVV
ncbi:hypothetical protein [Nocardioides sp.]|uniref:hypothetical protein n=1 Tax=Nocardioides sp. TaxID=35761 RepID=UPI0039E6E833